MAKQALEGTRLNAFAIDPDDLVVVGVDDGDGDGEHPLADPRADWLPSPEMVANIKAYGILQPILARKNTDGLPEVVAGRQRVLALRAANKELRRSRKEPLKAPVVLYRGDDSSALGAAISENELRRDDDPLAKAARLARFLAAGRDEAAACVAFGVTPTTVRSWRALEGASAGVKKAIRSGRISATAGAKIARLPKEEQPDALEVLLESEGKPTAERAARVARAKGQQDGGPAFEKPGKRLLRLLAEGDQQKLGLLPAVRQTLLWVMGEGPAKSVPTLEHALEILERALDEEPAEAETKNGAESRA